MIAGATTLGGHANARDSAVFRAEVIGKDVDFTYRFQRRLTAGGLTKNTPVRALAIERKVGSVALPSEELKFSTRSLSDVGVQIKERINIPAISRKIDHRLAGDRVTDGLIFRVDNRNDGGNLHSLRLPCHLQHRIGICHIAAIQYNPRQIVRSHVGGRY